MMQIGVNWRHGTIGPVWFRRLLWAWRWYWSDDYFPLSHSDTVMLCKRLDAKDAALRKIQQWDCLNPPRPELLADLPWLKRVVDAALDDSQADGRAEHE